MGFTFSATAPQFLPEQEQNERENLSKEELVAIENDINQIQIFQETEEMKLRGITELQEALVTTIPKMQRRAYEEAQNRVPHLVEKESNPFAFLRSEKYDAKVRMENEIFVMNRSTRDMRRLFVFDFAEIFALE